MLQKGKYGKILVYLDQFAVSNMVDAKEGDIWYNIKKNIEKHHCNEKIICPMSAEHVLETSQRDSQRAGMQDGFYWKLSDGYTFEELSYIIAGQICELIKNKDLHTFYLKHNPNWDLNEAECYDTINLLFNKEKKDAAQHLDSFNKSQLNLTAKSKILNFNKYKKTVLQKILEQNRLLTFKEKISSVIEKFDYINDFSKSNLKWLIDHDLIIFCLIFYFQFSKDDFCYLRDEIDKFGAERIDSLNIKLKLVSYFNVNGGNASMNDIIDYQRIATGLPYSDILFCDKKYKNYVMELGLNKKYNTKVFSATNEDLEYFLDYLNVKVAQ